MAHILRRKWRLFDAQGQVVGRTKSHISNILRGKHKELTFTKYANDSIFHHANATSTSIHPHHHHRILNSHKLPSPTRRFPPTIAPSLQHNMLPTFSRSLPLHGITVLAASEEMDRIKQIPRDFSIFSPEFEEAHQQIVTQKLPFNSTADIEFTNRLSASWQDNSFLGFLWSILTSPWSLLNKLYVIGTKVYLRWTRQYDRLLTSWVYQLLDVKVPLEDEIFDINSYDEDDHAIYSLVTTILRYQLALEYVLQNAILQTQYPEEFIKQQEQKAQQLGLSREQFIQQIDQARKAFHKQKLRTLKALQLTGVPDGFQPDDELVTLISNVEELLQDAPIHDFIQDDTKATEFIQQAIAEQLSQLPSELLALPIEFKGLATAVRSLQQPEHFNEYQKLLQLALSPDMSLRRSLRELTLQGTPQDYPTIRRGMLRSLQHIRRVIKTFQRQQEQLEEFGFIVRRRDDFDPNRERLSRQDEAALREDISTGRYAGLLDDDPEEANEGGSEVELDELVRMVPQQRQPRPSSRNRRRDDDDNEDYGDRKPLSDDELVFSIRLAHALSQKQHADLDGNQLDIDAMIADESHDQELVDQALSLYDGDLERLRDEMFEFFHAVQSETDRVAIESDRELDDDDNLTPTQRQSYERNLSLMGLRDQDYDEEVAQRLTQGLDPANDIDQDDEVFVHERLRPSRALRRASRDTRSNRGRRRNDDDDYYDEEFNEEDLPLHLERDPNPRIISTRMYNDAMQYFPLYQQRLAAVERSMFEQTVSIRQKYLLAERYFKQVLFDEHKTHQSSAATQIDMMQYVRSLFQLLPQEVRDDASQQYLQGRKDRLLAADKLALNRSRSEAHSKSVTNALPSDNDEDSESTNENIWRVLPDIPSLQGAIQPIALEPAMSSASSLPVASAPFQTMGELPALLPPGPLATLFYDVSPAILRQRMIQLNVNNDKPVLATPDSSTPAAVEVSSTESASSASSTSTVPASSSLLATADPSAAVQSAVALAVDAPSTTAIASAIAIPRTRADELEETHFMLSVVQDYQLKMNRDKYINEELEHARQRKELRLMQENDELLKQRAQLRRRSQREAPLRESAAKGDAKGDVFKGSDMTTKNDGQEQDDEELLELETQLDTRLEELQEEIKNIQVALGPRMFQRSVDRALQEVEMPLEQQLNMARLSKMTSAEIFNGEIVDTLYGSMRDWVQTGFYGSDAHGAIEHGVTSLLLSVLNQRREVEDYKAMSDFNERVQDFLNSQTRKTVGQLTAKQRKYLLMKLHYQKKLNQVLPLGKLPPLPFLADDSDQEQFMSFELQRAQQQAVSLTVTPKSAAFGASSLNAANLSEVDDIPSTADEIRLQEEQSASIVSKNIQHYIVTSREIAQDPFDAKYDIISQRNLLLKMKQVRDKRLRQLLQLVFVVGSDGSNLHNITKFHVSQLAPALSLTKIPKNVLLHLTHYYTHRSTAATLQEIIHQLSTLRQNVLNRDLDFNITEYDILLQYVMDMYQYHVVQVQYKMPDFFSAQFKALDLASSGFDKSRGGVIRPAFNQELSLKELTSVSHHQIDDIFQV